MLFKLDLGFSANLAFQSRVSKDNLVDDGFVEGDVHGGPRAHEEIVMTNFHRRLGLWSLGDQICSDYCHPVETVINSGHQSMAIGLV